MVQQESFNCVKGSLMEEKLSFTIETLVKNKGETNAGKLGYGCTI